MKLLTLLRHAKSVQDPTFAIDRERPLAPRGQDDAPLIGKAVARAGAVPDIIVSSPAVRARRTAELFAQGADFAGGIHLAEDIYPGEVQGLLAVIRGLPDTAEHALLVGHNPGFEELAAVLLGADPAAGGVRMPTAAAAHFELPFDTWTAVEPGRAMLLWHIIPRFLKKAG